MPMHPRFVHRQLRSAPPSLSNPPRPSRKPVGPGPATQGVYRFFENDDIDPEAIRDAHHQPTLERLRHQPVVRDDKPQGGGTAIGSF